MAATPTLRGPWLAGGRGWPSSRAVAADAPGRRALLRCFSCRPAAGRWRGRGGLRAGLDPTREIGLAAPYSGLRLLLIRTAAVLAVTVPIGLAGLLLALPGWPAAAWLLPAAALTGAALALPPG